MRVVFAGTPAVSLPTLEALWRSDHTLVGIVSREDAPTGRKQVLSPSPVTTWAREHGLPVILSNRPDAATNTAIAQLTPDIGVVVAYGAILTRATLDIPPHGWLNLHFSALPRWRGAAPVQRSILAGDTVSATTVFRLDEGVDTGKVFDTSESRFGPHESASAALARLARGGAEQVVRVLDDIEQGHAQASEQQGVASMATKVRSEEGWLNPAQSLEETYRRFRAMTDEPGAFVVTAKGRLKIIEASPGPDVAVPIGHIEAREGGIFLGVADGALEMGRVQPSGKGVMSATDWFRGMRDVSIPTVDV